MTDDKTIVVPPPDELRRFGIVTGALVAGLFGLLLPWLFGFSFPRWPWVLAVVLIGWGLAAPASLRWVYVPWMRFGLLMSKIMNPLVLAIAYYLVMTPVGFLMLLLSRDPMARKLDPAATTYRKASRKRAANHMERPF